ncbi:MAG: hypothetical protein ACLS7Z_11820 [Christensenellales bacterium]
MLPVGAGMRISALTRSTTVTARIRVSSAGFDWLWRCWPSQRLSASSRCWRSASSRTSTAHRMLGEEWLHSHLPATMSQHIAAKLIAAVVTL